MLILTRTVRFSVNPQEPNIHRSFIHSRSGYAGQPPVRGLGRHYELDLHCRGNPDPQTGYLLDIKSIDTAVQEFAVPLITHACHTRPDTEPGQLLAAVVPPLNASLGGLLSRIVWRLSPYHALEMTPSAPGTVLLRQKFDFAAAHRLHSPHLSDAQNRQIFGKCNNPSGHGHNYQVEPCVAAELDPAGLPTLSQGVLEELTTRVLIDRFDHKHLNLDTAEFSDSGGVNPTVENIARVFYDLLAPEITRTSPQARLASITVWETDRTSCTYPA